MDLLTGLVALSPDGLTRENMLMRTVCAQTVGLEPLPFEAVAASSEADPVLAEFAEQFSVDVAGVSAEQRAALMAAYGAEVLGVAMASVMRSSKTWRSVRGRAVVSATVSVARASR